MYVYNPNNKLRKAIIEWKRIARVNSVFRHLEVRAERFRRRQMLYRVYHNWKAYCSMNQ